MNFFPILVSTFELKGGLNHVTFIFLLVFFSGCCVLYQGKIFSPLSLKVWCNFFLILSSFRPLQFVMQVHRRGTGRGVRCQ